MGESNLFRPSFATRGLIGIGVGMLVGSSLLLAACGGAGSSVQKTTPQPVSTGGATSKGPADTKGAASSGASSAASPAAPSTGSPAPAVKQVTSPYPPRADQLNLLMAATPPEMSLHAFTIALGKLVTDNSKGKVNVTVTAAGGSPDSIRRLVAKEHQVTTISLGKDAYEAMTGTGDFADKPAAPDIRGLSSWAAVPQMMAVRKDRNVRTLQDLKGHRYAPGRAGSASEKTIQALLDDNGIKIEKYSGGVEDLTRATQDGEISGWNQSGPSLTSPDGNILSVQAVVPLLFLSLTEAEQKLWQEKHPSIGLGTVPPNVYPDQNYPITTIMFVTQISALKDLPEDVAYLITQTAIQDQQKIAASFPPYKDVDVAKLSLAAIATPLHKGAARYYQDIGVAIPDKIKPVD